MKTVNPLLLVVFLIAGLITFNLIAQSTRSQSNSRQLVQPQFEYATMRTQIIEEPGRGTVYQLTWNAGVVDFIGRSTTSLEDARRRLTAQLRVGNNARSNLSVLLSSIGQDGWRLIETDQNEDGLTRIFIRAQR